MILVTGSEGLVGRHLVAALTKRGYAIRKFDLRRGNHEDIRNPQALFDAVQGVKGIVHLAAVSRVIWAQRDPLNCERTNVTALDGLLRCCLGQSTPPWIVFCSSREVYGSQDELPIAEDARLRPMNTYGESKVAGEGLILKAAAAGLVANICRLSNVYGCADDHPDRVMMAFCVAAARGGIIRVEGSSNTFDFTPVADVADGIARLVEATIADGLMPPIHFVSGIGTTLGQLATMTAAMAKEPVRITEAPPRDFDVSCFVGNPERAATLLGWRAKTPLRAGIARLVADLTATGASTN